MNTIDHILTHYHPVIATALHASFPIDQEAFTSLAWHFGLQTITGKNIPSKDVKLPGKLLRPILTLVTYEGLMRRTTDAKDGQTTIKRILPAALAIEYLHNFSLIHDDIEDRDTTRHGRPTLWTMQKWQEKQAINAGDLLCLYAYTQLSKLSTQSFSPDLLLQIHHLFTQSASRIFLGQYSDMAFEERMNVTLDEYFHMISNKTGALIELSILLPAKLHGADNVLYTKLKNYSESLGKLFQLRDDYLGIWGEDKTTGKSNLTDISQRKKTYPVIYALEQAMLAKQKHLTNAEIQQFINFYSTKTATSLDKTVMIRSIMEKVGAKEMTEKIIANYYDQALKDIEDLDVSSKLKSDYTEFATFFAKRNY